MISIFLLEKKKICWNLIHHQICCLEHIINLVIQSFLFSDTIEDSDEDSDDEEKKVKKTWKKAYWKMKSHRKLHNIVIHIHNSETHTRDFKHLTERTISCDNSTRWNSWYLMLKIAIEKTAATDNYIKQWYETLQDDFLFSQDWKILDMISNFLQSFYWVTLKTEEDCATIDHVFFIMNILIKHFEKFLINCIILKILQNLDLT